VCLLLYLGCQPLTKFAKEVSLPSISSMPGLIEMRGYRNWITDQPQLEYEFESYEGWGRYMDNPKTIEDWGKFKSMVHSITSELLGPGMLTPQPIRAKR
jgi:hypothetical protein